MTAADEWIDPRPRDSIRTGAAILGVSQAFKVILQFIGTILMARLLAPSDFGLWAMVLPAIGLIALLQEAGLHQAVIHEERLNQRVLTELYWFALLLSTIAAAALLALSPLLGLFYHDDRVPPLVAAGAAQLLIQSVAAQHYALLTRSMRFRTLASIDASAAFATLLVGLAVAGLWGTYWAFAISAITGAALSSGLAWRASGWRPGRPRMPGEARHLMRFGVNVTGTNVLNYLSRTADNVIIARALGPVPLGFYDRAYKLLLFPLQNINAPAARLMVPLLSRRRSEPDRFREAYLQAAGQLSFLCVPGIAAAIVCANEVVSVLLGPEWEPAGPIFGWLAVAGLLQPLNSTIGWLFLAQGHTRLMLQWGVFGSLLSIASFLVGIRWGAEGVAAAYAIGLWTVKLPAMYVLIGRLQPITRRDVYHLQAPFVACVAATYLTTGWAATALNLSTTFQIVVALVLSYLFAATFLALSSQGRRTLRASRDNLHMLLTSLSQLVREGKSGSRTERIS